MKAATKILTELSFYMLIIYVKRSLSSAILSSDLVFGGWKVHCDSVGRNGVFDQ